MQFMFYFFFFFFLIMRSIYLEIINRPISYIKRTYVYVYV